MRSVFVAMIIAAASLTGCTRSSEQGGRAGNDTFRVSVPAIATAINQGEMQIVRITLDRGDGFKQPVKLLDVCSVRTI